MTVEETTQRLLRHHDLLADPSILNLYYVLGVDGPFDPEAFRASLVSLLDHYPMLGTFDDRYDGTFVFVDLAGGPAAEIESAALDLIESERCRPLDPDANCLVRVAALRFGPDKHLLLLSFHHAVADAWSLALYSDYLGKAYSAFTLGGPGPCLHPVPPSRPVPSAESADNDRLTLEATVRGWPTSAVDPWDGVRSGCTPLHYWARSVDSFFSDRMDAHASSRRITPFSLLASATAQAAGELFGLTDLVLGTIVAGRRTAASMQEGGAHYHGSLLPLRGPRFNPREVNRSVVATIQRQLSYHEQTRILADTLNLGASAEPALFLLADRHPMAELRLGQADTVVVFPSDRIPERPRAAHSPSCGRVALHWRQGRAGASLTIFSEPDLCEAAASLSRTLLDLLGRWIDAVAAQQPPESWYGTLMACPAPITEAVSPVRLPSSEAALEGTRV
jgi:hypothetical protein